MPPRPDCLPPLGFGAFKIGRNQGVKYPQGYDLPDDAESARLLNELLDAGCSYIDTAPAYGLSEERIGAAVAHRRGEYWLSSKVGETFQDGRSEFDFTAEAIRRSVERSLRRLRTDALDLLLIHSSGEDLKILDETDAVATLHELKQCGLTRGIGLSGKTVAGAEAALAWADALMVEFHPRDTSHRPVIERAAREGVQVLVKKGLASGHLPPSEAIPFILNEPGVTSLVVGGLNLGHFRDNLRIAREARS